MVAVSHSEAFAPIRAAKLAKKLSWAKNLTIKVTILIQNILLLSKQSKLIRNFVAMKANMDSKILPVVLSVAVIASVSYIFPSDSVVQVLMLSTATWFVTWNLYRRIAPAERAGGVSLLIFWLLLCVGCVLNSWWFTTAQGATSENPVFINNDAWLAWEQMKAVLSGGEGLGLPARRGYGYLLAWLSWGGTPTLLPLLWLNSLAILIAIVLTGASASRMAGTRSARVCTLAMICTGGVCYFLASGTILIKDAFSCLIMAMALYAFYGARRCLTRWILLSVAMLLAVPVRSHLLVFIAIAGVCSLAENWRSKVSLAAWAVIVGGALYMLVRSAVGDMPVAADGTTNLVLQGGNARLNAYNIVAGEYDSVNGTTAWYHLVRLPFSVAVQFLTPLPKEFARDTIFGPTLFWSHISYPWYALGGILLYVLFFRLRQAPRMVSAAMIFAVTATVMTAYATGGTISRYCLPWLPFFAPAAAWFLSTGGWRSRSFKYWAVCYVIGIAAAIAVVFYFIDTYSPGGWEAA